MCRRAARLGTPPCGKRERDNTNSTAAGLSLLPRLPVCRHRAREDSGAHNIRHTLHGHRRNSFFPCLLSFPPFALSHIESVRVLDGVSILALKVIKHPNPAFARHGGNNAQRLAVAHTIKKKKLDRRLTGHNANSGRGWCRRVSLSWGLDRFVSFFFFFSPSSFREHVLYVQVKL